MLKVRRKSFAMRGGKKRNNYLRTYSILISSFHTSDSVIGTIPSKSRLIRDWRTQLTLTERREEKVKETVSLSACLSPLLPLVAGEEFGEKDSNVV